ncbi:hypothetical protein EsH8_X_000524 [Colletotrichum jinshuiense]
MIANYVSYVVQAVLTALVLVPGIALLVLLLRKFGISKEPTRRWVNFTVAAFGFWCLCNLLFVIVGIMTVVPGPYTRYSLMQSYAMSVMNLIGGLLHHAGQASLFLALFYLARTLTLLRTDETSKRYRIGRLFALGTAGFIVVLALTAFCLNIAGYALHIDQYRYGYPSSQWARVEVMWLVAAIFGIVTTAFHAFCSIGAIVYVAKARNKVKNGPLHKASDLLLVCAILWLIRAAWMVVYIITSMTGVLYSPWYYVFDWATLVDFFLNTAIMFVVLVLLYVLATKSTYGLLKQQDQGKTLKEESV